NPRVAPVHNSDSLLSPTIILSDGCSDVALVALHQIPKILASSVNGLKRVGRVVRVVFPSGVHELHNSLGSLRTHLPSVAALSSILDSYQQARRQAIPLLHNSR